MSPAALAERYRAVRAASVALLHGLSAEDCAAQSMPDASPAKWHLAHTTWFFETFVLEAHEPGFAPAQPAFRALFNSYYQAIGTPFARDRRGLLTRPAFDEVLAWRADVDARIARLLGGADCHAPSELAARVELGLQHEQQHQELIVTDVKHLLAQNPLAPAWHAARASRPPAAAAPQWIARPAGLVEIGHAGPGFAFDNETPRHRVFLDAHALASHCTTAGDYLGFVRAGGYDQPQWWLAEGWDRVRRDGWRHPLYWLAPDAGQADWREFTVAGIAPLDLAAPVAHLSYYEADAYARWAGARLPTEAEWEAAAASADRRFADLTGTVWQWTASAYSPYPGYRPDPGAVGEYNGKFMVGQQVLRGGSWATPAGHARIPYRNFFPPGARWQIAGLRLARDCQG
ncbi:ergothioneine biosynthesis protein EgtB [Derxia lacustris]|uniref:ergothioneine biosynthesis protein EgtB n=1 Tax=Derxia lacustris TaxID=764842 RepID=UPI000A176467|nr:ergothioneine biosynthesis protein EgtB [Derxia lacustris]